MIDKPRVRHTFFRLLSFAALLALACTSTAQAGPIVWTINNGTFTGGGTISGSFTYDPTADTYGAFSISVTAAGTFTAFTYTDTAGATAGSGGTIDGHPILSFTASGNSRMIFMPFNPDLSSAGGTFPIYLSPGNSGELVFSPFDARSIASGDVSGTATPEPSTLALLSIGLLALKRYHTLRCQ